MDYTWLSTLRNRAADLAGDREHSLTWRVANELTKGVTRARIVEIYEVAYVELAESYQGAKDRIDELKAGVRGLEATSHYQTEAIEDLSTKATNAEMRLGGLLRLIGEIHDHRTERQISEHRSRMAAQRPMMSPHDFFEPRPSL